MSGWNHTKKRKIYFGATALFFSVIFVFVLGLREARAAQSFSENTLLRAKGDRRIYVISHNRKRYIPSQAILNSYGLAAANAKEVSVETLAQIPNTRAVKTVNVPTVFDIATGKRLAVRSAEEFIAAGYSYDEVTVVNQAELDLYPPGEEAGEVKEVSSSPVSAPEQSLLMKKITQARKLLQSAALLYPQEKRSTGLHTLAPGNTGPDVELVQETLQKLGFFPASIAPNGVFGPATERSVKAFQKAQGLTQTGGVGPQTAAALQKKGLGLAPAGTLMKVWNDTVPDDREVLLALWNQKLDDLQLVKITLQAKKVKNGSKTRTVYSVITKTSGFAVHYKGGTGVNVQYNVVSPPGYQVLANRFPIFDDSPGEIGSFPPVEEVYVPYNDAFRTPDIVIAGREYLDGVVNQALSDLRSRGVRSVTGNGLVADLINPDELKNLAIIEHVDAAEFDRATNTQMVVDRVFTVLGTNREEAYRFAGSSKGALGMAQFMSSSYAGIRNRYPAAKLTVDFKAAMADHVNAFKAMALYQDSSNSALEQAVRQKITDNPEELPKIMAEVRAAAYNGGPGRIKSALSKFGADWQVASSTRYGLFAETKEYLKKFKIVRTLALL